MKYSTNKPTIGEISIIPIGGINLRKKPKYGSHALSRKRPTADSWSAGIQDISM